MNEDSSQDVIQEHDLRLWSLLRVAVTTWNYVRAARRLFL